jgi:membrane-associated phospholipid phosphatase
MLIIYNTISLSVLFLLMRIIYLRDYTLLFGEMACTIIQHCIKMMTTGWYPPIFKRPDGACDCNLFNLGGKMDNKSGFPSGHVASVSFFMEMMILRDNISSWYNKLIYYIPVLLIAYARYMKKCHNIVQIIAGYILGFCMSNILYKYDDEINQYIKSKLSYLFNITETNDKKDTII